MKTTPGAKSSFLCGHLKLGSESQIVNLWRKKKESAKIRYRIFYLPPEYLGHANVWH